MADARLRRLERRWLESGDPRDGATLLLERQRRGELSAERLRLLCYLGHAPASHALGADAPQGLVLPPAGAEPEEVGQILVSWLEGLAAWGKPASVRASVGLARQLLSDWRDRHPDDTTLSGLLDLADAWTEAPTRRSHLAALRAATPAFEGENVNEVGWTLNQEQDAPSAVRYAVAWCHHASGARAAQKGTAQAARVVICAWGGEDANRYPWARCALEPELARALELAVREHMLPWVLAGGGEPRRRATRATPPLSSAVPAVEIPADVFRSPTPLKLFGLRDGERVALGQTPGEVSLAGVTRWWVRPVGGVRALTRPERLAGVPGLELRGFKVKDEHLRHVARLSQLAWLSLEGCELITDVGVEALGEAVGLRELVLRGCRRVGGGGLRALSRLPELRRLDLGQTTLSPAGYELLGRLTQLEALFLDACPGLDDARLQSLRTLTSLETLVLSGNPALTGAGLTALAPCERLRVLHLAGARALTDDGLSPAAGWTRLEELRLDDCQIRGAALARLPESLRVLTLTDCPLLHDEAFPALAQLAPRLRQLDLRANYGVINRRLQESARALQRPGQLELHLGVCWSDTDWPELELEQAPEASWDAWDDLDVEHRLEPSPSGRAGCRGCGVSIARGSLRFAECARTFEGAPSYRYYHLRCAARAVGDLLEPVLSAWLGELPERAELEGLIREARQLGAVPDVELARSGRSRCVACEAPIAEDSLRVITERDVPQVGLRPAYLHPACTLEHLAGDAALAKAILDGCDPALRERLRAELG